MIRFGITQRLNVPLRKAAPLLARMQSTKSSGTTAHTISANTTDAYSAGADDIPSYSSPSHMAYLAMHGRRVWLPLVMGGVYAAINPFVVPFFPSASLFTGAYLTLAVLAQRLSIHGSTNPIKKDLRGHVCVVTGGTSGIGQCTALQLLDMGAHVILPVKPGREEEAMSFFVNACTLTSADLGELKPVTERVTFIPMDYNDQLTIVSAAAKIKGLFDDRIDLLVNCAGVWREEPGVTKQDFEEHIGVNFLGPFHFTEAMLPSLRRSKQKCGRVVYVTCAAHNGVMKGNVVQERMLLRPTPDGQQITARCYSASKLGNIYHAQSIANRRYEGIPLHKNKTTDLRPVDVLCVDPGFSSTGLQRDVPPFFGKNMIGNAIRSLWCKNAYEGSQTVMYGCLCDEVENGSYYAECRHMPSGLSRRAQDARSREEVVRWAMGKTIAKYYTTK
ncbi:short chain dehydrogenase/reductase [Angomonas deanei]|uniref:Short chain dehydrogenase/Enoyl-(Acyl carrier protein) reductase, putative n=1 Tax=Angomonas deanei TaxID=59799 RepID=S9W6M3_9TRYP|nr:short chain dehydrogenase/reductase [Angomonas deanei]EPY42361.1 short chain dehydrogenase/reductase [Angomonas deanei]CAD2219765.1 short chain dehydrogenase/Enoyl-(Acyl carrier protein) reductase, putative [Angomonas deanei]|eukprot:EPY34896.1 short chain dehydrogenase/reductase [Angomonas deanei]